MYARPYVALRAQTAFFIVVRHQICPSVDGILSLVMSGKSHSGEELCKTVFELLSRGVFLVTDL